MKEYKVGYVPGVYDLFHIGHLNLIRNAKELCDYLIVGVLSDELVEFYKKESPYIKFEERIEIVRAIRYVDEAIEVNFSNTDKIDAWEQLHYNVHFSGDDHINDWKKEKELLEQRGATIVFLPYTKSISSSQIKKMLSKKE